MGNSRIEQIIEEIEDYIDTCKGPLLGSSDKIVVNRERMEELLRELRLKTPEEITADMDLSKPVLVMDHEPEELQEL